MALAAARWVVAGLLLVGCVRPRPVVVDLADGYLHLPVGGVFGCEGRPTSVDVTGRDVVLQAGCTTIRVAGYRNDVIAYVEPAATIEVTGSGNRVIYRQVRPGAPPVWIDRGLANTLLRNSRASWEQDHDWYQEQH